MHKRLIAGFAAAVVAAFMALPASAADWIMASGYADANFHTQNIRAFIDDVEKGTDGNLKITLNSNDTLIKLDAIKRAVQAGQIPIGEIRLGVYGNEDPMYILAGLPFIAPDYATAWLLKDVTKPYFDALFEKNGMKNPVLRAVAGTGLLYPIPGKRDRRLPGQEASHLLHGHPEDGRDAGLQRDHPAVRRDPAGILDRAHRGPLHESADGDRHSGLGTIPATSPMPAPSCRRTAWS